MSSRFNINVAYLHFDFEKSFVLFFSVVAPKIMPFSFGAEALEFGNSVQIQCVATEGDTPIQFSWSFSSAGPTTTLTQNGVSTMKLGERSSILMIDKIEHNHSGRYTCLAENQASNTSYTATLLVKGIPSVTPTKTLSSACIYPHYSWQLTNHF